MGQNNKKKKKKNNKNQINKNQINKIDNKKITTQSKKITNTNEKTINNNNKVEKKVNNIWKITTIALLLFIVLDFIITKHEFKYSKNINKNNDIILIEPQDSATTKKEEKYVLLGDSLFDFYNTEEFFKDYNVINSGINGITAKDMQEKLDEMVYKHNPTRVYILLGTNDIHIEYTTEETFENVKQIVEKIQEHDKTIEIYIVSLLPINTTNDEKIDKSIYKFRSNEKINEVNEYLKKYCKEKQLTYINVHDKLLDDNKQLKLAYTNEGLHITDLGYYHITMELLKYFD